MIVSICPTFYCNSRCDYCYLGSLRNSKEVIDINVLKATLDKITDKIDFVDIFGGEISLLPSSYLSELNKLAGTHCGVTTSLEDNRVLSFNWNINISLNIERENYFPTIHKLSHIHKWDRNIAMVMLPSVIEEDSKLLLDYLESLNINSVSFLRYYPGKLADKIYDIHDATYNSKLIDLIEKWKGKYQFDLLNYYEIMNCLEGKYSPLMSENVYISPQGKFGYVKYDPLEYFVWVDSYEEWKEACRIERDEYFRKCNKCKYFGHCYAEHLELNKECCGCYDLLEYFSSINTYYRMNF